MNFIAVGSTNPVKIEAVKMAVDKIWPGAEVVGVEVDSGVGDQPRSYDETIKGATNRARAALRKTGADLGVGLEGSIVDTQYGMFLSGWVAAVDKNGEIGIGGSGDLLLPEKIAFEIRKGRELGPVMDEFMRESNIKQKQGTVGILTNNLIPRADAFEKGVIYALSKFIRPDLYR